MIARVEPLTRTRAFRGPLDYRLRPADNGVEVGSVLKVKLAGAKTLAVVVELAEQSELAPERLSEPEEVTSAVIPPDLVELALWMAREYCSTPARALSLLLPPSTGEKRVLVAALTGAGREALDGSAPLTHGQRRALSRLHDDGPLPCADLGTPLLRRLEGRGMVTIAPKAVRRRPAMHAVGTSPAAALPLSRDQRLALAVVLEELASRRGGELLLHGVTGSGKTEVYLQAVSAVLAEHRTAIVLVPEIALTPQALARFQARFGDAVAVMHSGLSPGERHDEWQRLRRGHARVAVGARSAIFAPLANIGLIIVDEEHDASYKHDGDPRYDARLLAARRAERHRAVLLLGSATPRPESVHRVRRLRLRNRIDGRPLPAVEVLDMRGHHHPLHPSTRMALTDLRAAGGKAILLMNRRGWSNFLSCRGCGRAWMCPNCEVTLVLHARSGSIACHHCGHREPVPDRCPACASVAIARHGAGTERIESELIGSLGDPEFPVFRLDADVTGARRGRALERFAAAPAGVLVGTQMVAKGHDFPDVRLGVVLDADQTLRFPDFRAEERCFALITQLAGRAGRGDGGGRVLVQSLAPDARAIQFASHHDSDGFIDSELAQRQALAYPPFSSLIRIVCSSPDPASARSVAAALADRILPFQGARVLGPAPLFALRGMSRSQLMIKASDRVGAVATVGAAVDQLARARLTQGVNLSVDVDPV